MCVGLLFVVSACGDDRSASTPAVEPPEGPRVRAAYQRCVDETRDGLRADNPDAPAEMVQLLLEGAEQTCGSAVLITCAREREGQACQVILDVYDS